MASEFTIYDLIPRVFAARDIAQKHHWVTTSHAQHMALGEFYEAVIEALDTLVEAHQGMFGPLALADIEKAELKMEITMFREEAEWIEANRDLISSGVSAIGNLVDNLTAVYLKAAYKLERLV